MLEEEEYSQTGFFVDNIETGTETEKKISLTK
mgnify:CR=1 FL=1